MIGNVTWMASDKRHLRKLCQSVLGLSLAASPLYLLWGAAEALGPSPQPLQASSTAGSTASLGTVSSETRAGLLTSPFLERKRSNNLFYETKQEKSNRTTELPWQVLWGGYTLSIPDRDFLQGILVLSFLLPEKTDLGKDVTGCPAMLDMARCEKGTKASRVCLCAEQGSKEQIQVDSDLNQTFTMLWDPGTSPWHEMVKSCPHSAVPR